MKRIIFVFVAALFCGYILINHQSATPTIADIVSNQNSHLEMGALIPVSLPKPRVEENHSSGPNVDPTTAAYQSAFAYLNDHREEWQIQGYHELRPSISGNPQNYLVSYQVFQDGLPVMGMEIRLKLDQDNQVVDVENNYKPVNRVELSGGDILTPQEAIQRLPDNYSSDIASAFTPPTKEIYVGNGEDEAELVYSVLTKDTDNNSEPVRLVIQASNGEILNRSAAPRNLRLSH